LRRDVMAASGKTGTAKKTPKKPIVLKVFTARSIAASRSFG